VVASTPARRRARRSVALLPGAALVLLALTGCANQETLNFGWPQGITPQAKSMRDLWVGSVIAALVVGVFVWGLIFWAAVRYRRRGDDLPVQTRYNLPIEVLYTVVPFLIVAVLFYYTAVSQTYVTRQSENPDVTVGVVGFQWNWQFVYRDQTGPDGRPVQTVGQTNEIPVLVLPRDRTIRFVETSPDVIHSFWVPALLFKRDVIPGRQNSFEVTIEKEGSYVGRCAELCGTYHYSMNFEMRVVSPEQYDQWLASKRQGKSTPDALEDIGEERYATTTTPFETERTARRPS